MQRRGGVRGAAIAAACLVLGACSSGSSHPTPAPPSTATSTRPSSSTQPVTTTTRHINPVAADQLAELELTAALKAAENIFASTNDYTAVTPERITPLAPGARFAPLEQAGIGAIGLLAQDRHDVFMVTRSASGRWYCITENNTDGVSYGAGATFAAVNSNGECQAAAWPPPGSGP